MDIYIKEILNKILNKFDNIIFKRFYNIRNCKLVKYDIYFINERPIKRK